MAAERKKDQREMKMKMKMRVVNQEHVCVALAMAYWLGLYFILFSLFPAPVLNHH